MNKRLFSCISSTIEILCPFLQVGSFGSVVYNHIDFISKSEVALKHLYFDGWDDVEEPYTIYSRPNFFDHLDNLLKQVGIYLCRLSDLSNMTFPQAFIASVTKTDSIHN